MRKVGDDRRHIFWPQHGFSIFVHVCTIEFSRPERGNHIGTDVNCRTFKFNRSRKPIEAQLGSRIVRLSKIAIEPCR